MARNLAIRLGRLWAFSLPSTTLSALLSSHHPTSSLPSRSPLAPEARANPLPVANHNSVVDDPMMWSLLPLSTYFPFARPSYTCANSRWTLGASDIMFTSPAVSRFFRLGQVIETVRGGGIYQAGVDEAIRRIEEGGWVSVRAGERRVRGREGRIRER